MRHYTCEFLDIANYLARGVNPEKCLRRSGNDIWYVRKEPIDFSRTEHAQDPMHWALVRSGDMVRVPLIPYRSSSLEPHELMMAVIDIAQRSVIDHHAATRIHWVVGRPVEDLRPEAEAFRIWLGLAMQTH